VTPLTIKVQGQDVMVVEEFVYLGSLIHSSTGSTCDISERRVVNFRKLLFKPNKKKLSFRRVESKKVCSHLVRDLL